MRKRYATPCIVSEQCLKTNVLACAKGPSPPPGSHHFYSAYDTFTGHFGPGITEELHGVGASATGSVGIGFGPGGTSLIYGYSGMCLNWVTMVS